MRPGDRGFASTWGTGLSASSRSKVTKPILAPARRRLPAFPRSNVAKVVIAGFALYYLFVVALPVIQIAWSSLHNGSLLSGSYAGISNYRAVWDDPVFHTAVWVTIKFVLLTVPLEMVIGFVLAEAILSGLVQPGWRKLAAAILFFPAVIPISASAVVWKYLFTPTGPLNELLSHLGIGPVAWLTQPGTSLLSLAITTWWSGIGWSMILFLAGLVGLPVEIEEAARVDGAGLLRRWRSVIVPMLRPTIAVVWLYTVTQSALMFTQVLVMTGGNKGSQTPAGGPLYSTTTVVWDIYNQAFNYDALGYAAALSIIVLLAMAAFTFFQVRSILKRDFRRT